MLSGIRNFFYRHKKKFIVGGIVISGAVLFSKYTQRKLIEWHEQETKDYLEKIRREHYFRSVEKTCNQTISTLAESLRETIVKLIDTEDLLKEIRHGHGNKIILWELLKVEVFAQLFTFLYSGLMLVIILRIQLSILGGYMFREKMNSESNEIFSSTFQEHYLSLCHHFLNKGVKDVSTLLQTHSRLVLENTSLKEKMSLQDIEQIFWGIQSSLHNDPYDPLENLSKYLLPPIFNNTVYKGVDSDKMKQIVNETFEILQNEEVRLIADSCIKRAFSNVVDKIASNYYSINPLTMNSSYFGQSVGQREHNLNITKVSMPLAKIVPIVHGIYKEGTKTDIYSTFIGQFLVMEDINNLADNLFEAFTEVV